MVNSVVQLVETIAKSLVDHPEDVFVTETEEKDGITIQLKVAAQDMGKVIGRHGKIAKAIRTLMRAAAISAGVHVRVDIVDADELGEEESEEE